MTSLREACWLLRCCGFGAAPRQVQWVRRQGYTRAVDHWLSQTSATPAPEGWARWRVQSLIDWWLERMFQPQGFLLEKMTLFWHGFFTTSSDPVFAAALLLRQNQMLRDNAWGRFGDLLQQVSRDPAMLVYLDGFRNKKAHPNENFAREVMELFTVGPGLYSEEDLREAARAFTGWGVDWLRGGTFRYNLREHDDGPKKFLDLRGNLDGTRVLQRLASDPACALHVCQRLWSFFTGHPTEVQESQRLARVFVASHGNLKVVLRNLLLGDAFRACASLRTSIKSPLEYVLGLSQVADVRSWWGMNDLKKLGQLPFLPPNVAGWSQGDGWINTATLGERLRLVRQMQHARSNWMQKVRDLLQGCSPGQAAERLLWSTHQLDASPELRSVVADAYSHGRPLPEVVQLILASPEAQLR